MDPTNHPKRHPDPISRLPQYTFQTDQHTHRLTDGLGDRSVHERSARYADRERRAKNISRTYTALGAPGADMLRWLNRDLCTFCSGSK